VKAPRRPANPRGTPKRAQELQRTVEKINHFIRNPAPDSEERMLSATATQKQLALDIHQLETQPSRAGQGRKGYRAPIRHAVARIRVARSGCDLKALLEIFEADTHRDETGCEEDDLMSDLRGQSSDPIKVKIQEVSRDDKVVYYKRLDNGREAKIKFHSLQNYLNAPD
jgi:hypothetical protein